MAAEERGFTTLATIDRVAFPNHDSLIALAAAAAVTERIELLPNIFLVPTRDPVLLAKETATLASISRGRLTLGVGVGGRPDDYAVIGVDFGNRGRRLDAMLETMTKAWRSELVEGSAEPVVPPVPGGSVPFSSAARATPVCAEPSSTAPAGPLAAHLWTGRRRSRSACAKHGGTPERTANRESPRSPTSPSVMR
jgi:alkanesulfonate monooxygenase SsuD/methylene tetrahydromethanopterin reductase-like flavin-dependent oxidoreductase (luciferase family)